MTLPALSVVNPKSATSSTPAAAKKALKFGDAPLTEAQLPTFLARAAHRAYRKNLLSEPAKPDLTSSPGFVGNRKQAQQVEKLAALGLTKNEIARVLMIEPKLLEFYYGYEMGTAKIRANLSVAKVALDMALAGDMPDMTRFWLTHQAGWKATTVVEHNGIDAAADEARSAREKLIGSGSVYENAAGGADVEDRVP